MIKKKYFSLFISALVLTVLVINGNIPIFSISKAIATDKQEVLSGQQDIKAQENFIAQFGLPNIFNQGIPDIPGQINQRIDRVESQIRSHIPNVLLPLLPENLLSRENIRLSEFSNYFGRDLPTFEQQPKDISQTLETVANTTGHRYAMIYVSYQEEKKGLEFLLFSPSSEPQTLYADEFDQPHLENLVKTFRSDLVNPIKRKNSQYLTTSKTLYQALITPIESYLKNNKIDSLIFSLDQGLRSLPLAALYDGDRYLIEKYSISIVPSFFDINSHYTSLKTAPVLAMGAENIPNLDPLPGAALEVDAIANLTKGQEFLNEQFTVPNLISRRKEKNYSVVHLATHANFNSGSPDHSAIYFWDNDLKLNEMNQLKLDKPSVELLVLSACQTALGSHEAELGFAGLTIASGAKTALGSLWSVSDSGTLILMQDFYNSLQKESTKSEALRKAQLAMLKGNLRVVNGQVRDGSGAVTHLQITEDLENFNLSELVQPYYWSGFTLVGQPW